MIAYNKVVTVWITLTTEDNTMTLILSRKQGERIILRPICGPPICLTMIQTGPNRGRIGLDAHPDVSISREELLVFPPWCDTEKMEKGECYGMTQEQIDAGLVAHCRYCRLCELAKLPPTPA